MTGRGAYIVKLDLGKPHLSGVADKVRSQVAALNELPAKVDLYHLSGGNVVRNGEIICSAGSGLWAARLAHYLLFHLVLATQRAPLDFLYIRYQGTSPLANWVLRVLRKRNPQMLVIVEFPSWPYDSEAVSIRDKLLSWLDRRSRTNLHRHVDWAVTFSRQPSILGMPTIATDNGVDVTGVPLLPKSESDGCLRLFGMANLSFWHGYDRVVEGIARYYAEGGTSEVFFDVVGTGRELPRLQRLTEKHGLGNRVCFHGARRGADLDSIMASANIGISSIGMHRLDVDTSNLKSREFCARGLPFVIGYTDRDFPPGFIFAYHVPANDSPLDIAHIIDFIHRLSVEQPDYPLRMRAYAEEHLTWRAKMQPILVALREPAPGRSVRL